MDGKIPKWQGQTNLIVDVLYEVISLPTEYSLSLPYPNPFNPVVNLDFSIPEESHVKLVIYDIRGRVVQELLNEVKKPGIYQWKWSADNYASGIYFIQFDSNNFTEVRKITLLK